MITAVHAAGWTAVAVLVLVGVPLLAWWVSRWRRWSLLRPGAGDDPWVDLQRRHRLTPAEMHRTMRHLALAEQWPRAPLTDPVLRAAAVDWERWHLDRAEARAARSGVRGLLSRVVEAPMRSRYRRVIAQHGGSAEPVRRDGAPS